MHDLNTGITTAGEHAPPPAIEAAWRVLSACGTLRRFEADVREPIGGSARRGEAAIGALARGQAREAAEKKKKWQCRQ